MMVFGAIDDVSLGFWKISRKKNIKPELLEQGVQLGRGGGLKSWEGPCDAVERELLVWRIGTAFTERRKD